MAKTQLFLTRRPVSLPLTIDTVPGYTLYELKEKDQVEFESLVSMAEPAG